MNQEFTVEAIRLRPLNFAANELARDTSFTEHVLGRNPDLLDYIEGNCRYFLLRDTSDRPHDYFTLKMFPAWVRNHTSLVKAVISQDSAQFKCASEEIRDDQLFALFAISESRDSFLGCMEGVSEGLCNNKEFAHKTTQMTDLAWF